MNDNSPLHKLYATNWLPDASRILIIISANAGACSLTSAHHFCYANARPASFIRAVAFNPSEVPEWFRPSCETLAEEELNLAKAKLDAAFVKRFPELILYWGLPSSKLREVPLASVMLNGEFRDRLETLRQSTSDDDLAEFLEAFRRKPLLWPKDAGVSSFELPE